MSNVIVIGGGCGGLFTGAILAREGMHVTVVEKNATVGGGLQTFRRFGERFDTGMHVIGGMQQGGNIRQICRYLGILDRVRVKDVDDNCTDRLYFAEDKTWFRISKGNEGFVDSLSAYFPQERQHLEEYVRAIHRLVDEVGFFRLKPFDDFMAVHSDEFMMAADAFIAKYVEDRRLRSVLAYMNPLYGGRGNQTPAYIHAIISVLYIEGASRFVGGSDRFASLLASVITDAGGEIVTNDAVEWIEVNDKRVDFVRTKSGRILQGDWYVSDIHPCALFSLTDDKAFPRAYRERLNSIPNSYSAFSLYIKLKERSFPYINYSEYYMTRYDDIWNFGRADRQWPLGFLCMTPPDENQGEYCTKMLVTAPMRYEEAAQWENSSTGHRGAGYTEWKEKCKQRLLELMEVMHPGFSECIVDVNSSSPLTIRDFYASKQGCLCGFSKDYANIALSQVPVATKVRNLLLTGQNNNLHGFCGVALTAIQTCEAILGRNVVLNHIAACQES